MPSMSGTAFLNPTSRRKLATAVIGFLLLHCICCGALIWLQELRKLLVALWQYSSKVTIEQMFLRPLTVPPTTDEEKFITGLVKRLTISKGYSRAIIVLRSVTVTLTADEKKFTTGLVERLTKICLSIENILTLTTLGHVQVHSTQFSNTQ